MKNNIKVKNKKKRFDVSETIILLFSFLIFLTLFFSLVLAAEPTGPDSVVVQSNETKGAISAYEINISGGYISRINITSRSQNPRWKAMVGNVIGSFTLDDATGSTIFDWSLASVSGEIFATRNSSTPNWSAIKCASLSNLEAENVKMEHTNPYDNITATFNLTEGATHSGFTVATKAISQNTCPTLNTYSNSNPQDSDFEEIALTDDINIIYATLIEENAIGFDGNTYDFQMIVPENGNPLFTGATAYYLYIELT